MYARISIAVLMSFFLSACGGGSSGDGGSDQVVVNTQTPDPVVSNPVIPGPIVTNPVTPDPVTTDPVVTNPVTPDPVTTDPVVTNPVTSDPVITEPVVPSSDSEILSNLFGRTIFTYGFSGASSTFIYDATFSEEDLAAGDDGRTRLIDTVQTAFRDDSQSSFMLTGPTVLGCSYIEISNTILCAEFFDSGSIVLLSFEIPVDGRANGNFEFCAPGDLLDECSVNLIQAPDGIVVVTVDPIINAAFETDFRGLDAANSESNLISLHPYLVYENQGQLSLRAEIPTLGTAEELETNEKIEAIINHIDSLR